MRRQARRRSDAISEGARVVKEDDAVDLVKCFPFLPRCVSRLLSRLRHGMKKAPKRSSKRQWDARKHNRTCCPVLVVGAESQNMSAWVPPSAAVLRSPEADARLRAMLEVDEDQQQTHLRPATLFRRLFAPRRRGHNQIKRAFRRRPGVHCLTVAARSPAKSSEPNLVRLPGEDQPLLA